MTRKVAERRGREGILQGLEVLILEQLSCHWSQVGKRPSVWKSEFLRADLHGIASFATERAKPALMELWVGQLTTLVIFCVSKLSQPI